jgi:hypothetical protein
VGKIVCAAEPAVSTGREFAPSVAAVGFAEGSAGAGRIAAAGTAFIPTNAGISAFWQDKRRRAGSIIAQIYFAGFFIDL